MRWPGGRGFRLVHLAHHADDAARDGEIVALVHDDGAVLRVCGTELDVVVLRLVVLDGRFVVHLGHDDFAAFGGFLLAGEDKVAIEDAGVNHGVALDTEREHVGTAGEEVAVDGDGAFEVLDGENRRTGGNAAYNGDFDGVARGGFGCGTIGIDNFDTAAQTRRAVDVALLDEGGEDGTYTVRRGNLEMVADFADGRRHVVFFRVLLDVLVDF